MYWYNYIRCGFIVSVGNKSIIIGVSYQNFNVFVLDDIYYIKQIIYIEFNF